MAERCRVGLAKNRKADMNQIINRFKNLKIGLIVLDGMPPLDGVCACAH
jgi:hypothetical protein